MCTFTFTVPLCRHDVVIKRKDNFTFLPSFMKQMDVSSSVYMLPGLQSVEHVSDTFEVSVVWLFLFWIMGLVITGYKIVLVL